MMTTAMIKRFGMASGKVLFLLFNGLCLLFLPIALLSCQHSQEPLGKGDQIQFSEERILVDSNGGHYVVSAIGFSDDVRLQIECIYDKQREFSSYWLTEAKNSSLQLNGIIISYLGRGSKIEIDVAPSNVLEEWEVYVYCGNDYGFFTVIQNAEQLLRGDGAGLAGAECDPGDVVLSVAAGAGCGTFDLDRNRCPEGEIRNIRRDRADGGSGEFAAGPLNVNRICPPGAESLDRSFSPG